MAEAFAGAEKSAKKMTDGTREAKREQEEMGRIAKRAIEDARTPLQRYNEQLLRLTELLHDGKIKQNEYDLAVQKAKGSLHEAGTAGENAFGPRALGMVRQFAGALGIGGGIAGAVALIKAQWQQVIEVQRQALDVTLSQADAQAGAIQMLGPRSAAEREDFIKRIGKISERTGVSEKDLYVRSQEALSARGDLPVSRALEAVEASAEMERRDTQAGKALAGGALDIEKVMPVKGREALGYLQYWTEKARLTDLGDVSQSLAPALTAAIGSGSSPNAAGAAWAAITQSAVDPTGRRSKTAGIQLFAQLEKFLPAEGDQYSEAQYQHDKAALERERKAKGQAAEHAVDRDPQLLQRIAALRLEENSLPRLGAHANAARRTAQQMKRDELARLRQTAREEAEARVAASPEFAGSQERFALEEQKLAERRQRSKAIIATGLRSVEGRIAYLQTHPQAAKKFMEQASFEAVAEMPVRQLVTGKGRAAEAYKEFVAGAPKISELEGGFQKRVKLKYGTPIQAVAKADTEQQAASEALATANLHPASVADVRKYFRTNLEQAGEGYLSAKATEFLFNRLVPNQQLEFAAHTYRGEAAKLRGFSQSYYDKESGEVRYTNKSLPTTPEGLKQAEAMDRLAASVEKLIDELKKNSEATEENTKGGSPPALGPQHDPGDRR